MQEHSSGSDDTAARYGRTIDYLGREGFERLRASRVMVLGLGGVGSHAASALVRAGIGRITVVDFDQVTWSSLNRNAFAVARDVGRPKAQVLRDYLMQVDPSVEVGAVEAFVHHDSVEELMKQEPNFVVDAIDSAGPKVALLRHCHQRLLSVVSCMGAAGRSDPTLLRVGDIGETRICPLARVIRKQLRRVGIVQGITTVFSVEEAVDALPPDLEEETLRRGRARNRLPSLGVMPGIFGYAAAGVVISRLTGVGVSKG